MEKQKITKEKERDYQPFNSLNNVDTFVKKAGLFARTIALISIVATAIVSLYALKSIKEVTNKVYVVNSVSGDSQLGEASGIYENREVEIKDHIRDFYNYFLTLDPNQQQIDKTTEKALNLGGESVKKLFNTYLEARLYNSLIQNNIQMRPEVDSIFVDCSVYPYKCWAYGKQILTRKSNTKKKWFNFQCNLMNIKRTDLNPHGLMIENIEVKNNREI